MGSGAAGPCNRRIDGEHHRYAVEARGHSRCTVYRRSIDLASTDAVSAVHGKSLINAYPACLGKMDVDSDTSSLGFARTQRGNGAVSLAKFVDFNLNDSAL
jgi:hypothetical protein